MISQKSESLKQVKTFFYLRVMHHPNGHPAQSKPIPHYASRKPTLCKIKRTTKQTHNFSTFNFP